MDDFQRSYLGRLRQVVGSRLVLMPGARCVIEDGDGRVLLQLRGDFRVWGLPAGFCEEGEGVVETLVREVEEETGLTVLDPEPWGFASDPEHSTLVYPNGDAIQGFGLDFVARRWRGEPKADGVETLALDWFRPEAPPEMVASHRRTLDFFIRYKETGRFQLF